MELSSLLSQDVSSSWTHGNPESVEQVDSRKKWDIALPWNRRLMALISTCSPDRGIPLAYPHFTRHSWRFSQTSESKFVVLYKVHGGEVASDWPADPAENRSQFFQLHAGGQSDALLQGTNTSAESGVEYTCSLLGILSCLQLWTSHGALASAAGWAGETKRRRLSRVPCCACCDWPLHAD